MVERVLDYKRFIKIECKLNRYVSCCYATNYFGHCMAYKSKSHIYLLQFKF